MDDSIHESIGERVRGMICPACGGPMIMDRLISRKNSTVLVFFCSRCDQINMEQFSITDVELLTLVKDIIERREFILECLACLSDTKLGGCHERTGTEDGGYSGP